MPHQALGINAGQRLRRRTGSARTYIKGKHPVRCPDVRQGGGPGARMLTPGDAGGSSGADGGVQ